MDWINKYFILLGLIWTCAMGVRIGGAKNKKGKDTRKLVDVKI